MFSTIEVANFRLLTTQIAFERAQRDGITINALSDLVPSYIPDIPIDPFGGNPLRFNSDERLLYSIGRDLIDAGGATENEESLGDLDEIVILVPRD